MIIQVEDNKGAFEVEVPLNCSEITLSEYHDFKAASYRLTQEEDEESRATLVAECISYIIRGDIERLPIYSAHQGFAAGKELTVYALYEHLVNLIEKEPINEMLESFDWKGSTYFANPNEMLPLTGMMRPLTVAEDLTAREYRQHTAKKVEEEGDEFGVFAFSLDASMLAILFRKKGEHLPIRKLERQQFITDRARLFSDLPLSIARCAGFFLESTMMQLFKTPSVITSFLTKKKSTVTKMRWQPTKKLEVRQSRRAK